MLWMIALLPLFLALPEAIVHTWSQERRHILAVTHGGPGSLS